MKEIAKDIQRSYESSSSLTVHWDGKLLPDDGKQKVDRLPVIVTDPLGTAKLLGAPKLPEGTGEAAVTAVLQSLEDWKLSDKVVGMSFDTTASNTGAACTWSLHTSPTENRTPTVQFRMSTSHFRTRGRGSILNLSWSVLWSRHSHL